MNVHRSIAYACAIALFSTVGCGEEKPTEKADHADKKAETPPPPEPVKTAEPAKTAEPKKEEPAAEAAPPPPPADEAETPGKAPGPKFIWVHGYHFWDGKKYEWHKGYWDDEAVFATSAPPAIKVEKVWRSPGPTYFYMPGYWHFIAKDWAWAPGHWGVKREGYAYTHPYYVEEKGHWLRHGFGWEKEDAAWKKRYTGWEAREQVYVHKNEVAEYEKRGEREGWYKKH